MVDRQSWHRLQGVSAHTPRPTQLSPPVAEEQLQLGVVSALLQYWPPAVSQSLSFRQVPAGLVMLSMVKPVTALPVDTPSRVQALKLPTSMPSLTLQGRKDVQAVDGYKHVRTPPSDTQVQPVIMPLCCMVP